MMFKAKYFLSVHIFKSYIEDVFNFIVFFISVAKVIFIIFSRNHGIQSKFMTQIKILDKMYDSTLNFPFLLWVICLIILRPFLR